MRIRRLTLAFLIVLISTAALSRAAEGPSSAEKALGWLKGLIGDWSGTAEWSGGRTGKYDLEASYSTTGHGSAVVEDLIVGGEKTMTSVYHLDGNDLRMTHYCAAANQPRLKAASIDEMTRSVKFQIVDITGRQGPGSGNVNEAGFQIRDDDHITLFFTFVGRGAGNEKIELTRRPKK